MPKLGSSAAALGFFVSILVLGSAASNCGSDDDAAKTSKPDAGEVLTGPVGKIATWTTGAGRKVQPTTAPAATNAVAVTSVRDAYVGSQLVIRGTDGYLQGVSANVTGDLSDGAGHTLPAAQIALYREVVIDFSTLPAEMIVGNSPVPANSPTQDGRVGDPLVPLVDPESKANVGQPFNVLGGSNVALFVDVHVPKGLTAGTYTGTIHVEAAAGGKSDVPISVQVLDLDLPDMRTVTTHFKLSINELLQYHGNVSACSGGSCYLDISKPETLKLIKRYEELAHEHRIDIGQSLVFQPVNKCLIPTESDWAAYDAAMQPYIDGSYYADGVGSSFYDLPFSPGQVFGVDQDCDEAGYKALAAAWAAHLTSKGWFPAPATGGFGAVVYAYDEPMAAGGDLQAVLTKIERDSSWLQASMPGSPSPWKSRIIDTVAPIAAASEGRPATSPQLDPALGIYVVNLPQYGAGFDPFYGSKEWQTTPGLFNQGIALWFYESNSVPPPYPTFATNTIDANEPVVMMWGSWYEKATGFLYWDISAWEPEDPWGPNTQYGKTGDGVLVYPGNHNGAKPGIGSPGDVAYDGPIASYRLKMIRQGLQDWALFRFADTKGLTTTVAEQVKTVYHQMGGTMPAPAGSPYWTTDDAAMDAARKAVVTAILAK